jgi:hypothetical protein
MRALFGRFLQVLGMTILPFALYIGLVRDLIRLEVLLLFIGGALFLIGRLFTRGADD